ncbi:hypothetical protein [Planococcus halocryophilus]|uniref:hypothetical protein n=1 Tax=Planococcus halocryophilus TaxID=1215089 RepID=UPI001F0FF663|nr:hypothetical protein [Planococcus halocryophilus]MCH4825759.1 hypothetical protein [Planococcus halocryophilus]
MNNLVTFLPLFFKTFNKSEREYILRVSVKAVDEHKHEDDLIDYTFIRLVDSFCVYATHKIDTAGRIEAMNFNEEELEEFKWELHRAIGERYFGKQMIS